MSGETLAALLPHTHLCAPFNCARRTASVCLVRLRLKRKCRTLARLDQERSGSGLPRTQDSRPRRHGDSRGALCNTFVRCRNRVRQFETGGRRSRIAKPSFFLHVSSFFRASSLRFTFPCTLDEVQAIIIRLHSRDATQLTRGHLCVARWRLGAHEARRSRLISHAESRTGGERGAKKRFSTLLCRPGLPWVCEFNSVDEATRF